MAPKKGRPGLGQQGVLERVAAALLLLLLGHKRDQKVPLKFTLIRVGRETQCYICLFMYLFIAMSEALLARRDVDLYI